MHPFQHCSFAQRCTLYFIAEFSWFVEFYHINYDKCFPYNNQVDRLNWKLKVEKVNCKQKDMSLSHGIGTFLAREIKLGITIKSDVTENLFGYVSN